jgi:hypothetical protein
MIDPEARKAIAEEILRVLAWTAEHEDSEFAHGARMAAEVARMGCDGWIAQWEQSP